MKGLWSLRALGFGVLLVIALLLCGCAEPMIDPGSSRYVATPEAPDPGTGAHYVDSDWATVHRDSRNSDYVPLQPGADVEIGWVALQGAALLVGPVFGREGNLYVTSGRGTGHSHLHSFTPEGTLRWQTPPMESVDDFDHAAVVIAPIIDTDGHVFAGDSNQLWSFTAAGEPRWVVDLPAHGVDGFFITPIFSGEGHVGGVSTDGKVAFFDRTSGALAYPVLDLPGTVGPASEPVPPGLWQGGLIAPEFILPLWDLVFGREIEVANTPSVHPETGRIFITAAGATENDGVLYGIDTSAAGATIAFTAAMGSGSGTSPTISLDGERVYAIDDAGLMVALDTRSGERVWEAGDTMGQASPSIGPDETVYSFNGMEGTIVAIDGETGAVEWRQQYDHVAEAYLSSHWFAGRAATVDGIITVTDNGLWAFLDLCYEIGEDEEAYAQPRRIVLAHLDAATGDYIGGVESPDASAAFAVPASDGSIYLTLGAASTSISYYGVNEKLPFFLRSGLRPTGGLVALKRRR